jgi:CDP-glycerol glycerophosphotransferase (TagB/SpsB family)
VELFKPGAPTWKFTFLQHGVIKDDLSRWLNGKAVDLFVTSTAGEYESIAGDGNGYTFSSKEVKLTGLPRFDKVRRISASLAPQDRNLILVAPTWRFWLLPPLEKGSQRRTVREDFLATEYAVQWLAVLRSPELATLAREHDLRIGFLPHPNLQSILAWLDLPAHVEALTFDGADVQRLFASAAVLVTDYSSMSFNAAYVDRPVVYFQFDAEAVRSGGHVGRGGYYDYERAGFGPVTATAPQTLAAVREIVERGCTPSPEYAQRIAETFVQRDGRCCERVVAEIERLTRLAPRPKDPRTPAKVTLRAPAREVVSAERP